MSAPGDLRDEEQGRQSWIAWKGGGLAVALFGFIAFSFYTAVPYPDDHDGVNFILGVGRFDILWHQPHFPGYPVYIAAGKAAAWATGSAQMGLIAVSSIAMGISAIMLALLAVGGEEKWPAIIIAVALMTLPVVFQFSHKIFSEPLGLALLCSSALAAPGRSEQWRRWIVCGALLGLMLGARLSWWPFILGFAVIALGQGSFVSMAAGLAGGCFIWLAPLGWSPGLVELASTGFEFTQGHFNEWGGAAGPEGIWWRGAAFIKGIGSIFGIGANAGAWPLAGVMMGVVVLVGAVVRIGGYPEGQVMNSGSKALLLGSGAYLVWLFFGQNVEKSRHFMPFIPVAALALSPVAKQWPKAMTLAVAVMISSTSSMGLTAGASAPPSVQMRQWLEENAGRDTVVYCGWAERYFDLRPSHIKVHSVPNSRALDSIANSELSISQTRLACDDIPGSSFGGPPVVEFFPRPGDLVDKPLRLYSI